MSNIGSQVVDGRSARVTKDGKKIPITEPQSEPKKAN